MRRGRSARSINAFMAALLGGLVAFGSVPQPAYAQKAAPKAAAKPAAAKPAAGKKKPAKGAVDPEEAKRLEARKNYEDAETKFSNGDYTAAYSAYKAANDLIPAPQTLYKMALALDKAGQTEEAIAAYGVFVDSNPPASMES